MRLYTKRHQGTIRSCYSIVCNINRKIYHPFFCFWLQSHCLQIDIKRLYWKFQPSHNSSLEKPCTSPKSPKAEHSGFSRKHPGCTNSDCASTSLSLPVKSFPSWLWQTSFSKTSNCHIISCKVQHDSQDFLGNLAGAGFTVSHSIMFHSIIWNWYKWVLHSAQLQHLLSYEALLHPLSSYEQLFKLLHFQYNSGVSSRASWS